MGNEQSVTNHTASLRRSLSESHNSRGSETMSADRQSGPLTFHAVCGENVRLLRHGRVAHRHESFCKGLAFSARPIDLNETVGIKFTEVSSSWSGVLRFGVTNNDPNTFRNALPKFACPDLTSKEGTWAKALPERYCKQDTLLHFVVNPHGDLTYGIDGQWKGVFLSNIDVSRPLYVLVDIYGNSTCVEFIRPDDIRFRPDRSAGASSSGGGGGRTQVVEQQNNALNEARAQQPARVALPPASSSHERQSPQRAQALTSRHGHRHDANNLRFNAGITLSPLCFHTICGRYMRVNSDKTVAIRSDNEYSHGYVFTGRHIKLNETVVVQVLQTIPSYTGGMAFGLTNCDPLHVRADSLPDDADELMDRPEYWVLIKDVAGQPNVNDELTFRVDAEGRVHMTRNNELDKVIMHVDQSLKLFMWWDIYGSTSSVRLCGVHMQGPITPAQSQATASTTHTVIESGAAPAWPPPIQPQPVRTPPARPVHQPKIAASAVPLTPPPLPARNTQQAVLPVPLNASVSAAVSVASSSSVQYQTASSSAACASTFNAGPVNQHSNNQASDSNECCVCMSAQVDCVLYKCGHMCMCTDCAKKQHDRKGECPMCREVILDVIKTYKN